MWPIRAVHLVAILCLNLLGLTIFYVHHNEFINLVAPSTGSRNAATLNCTSPNWIDRLSVAGCGALNREVPQDEVFAILVANDLVLQHAIALEMSFRNVFTARRRVAVVLPDLSQEAISILRDTLQMEIIMIERVPRATFASFQPYDDRWLDTIYKLWYWKHTQFKTIVALDADQILLSNIEELFDVEKFPNEYYGAREFKECQLRPESEVNAATQIIRPSAESFDGLMKMIADGSGDGPEIVPWHFADQEIPARFFAKRAPQQKLAALPQKYMIGAEACLCDQSKERMDRANVKVVHFGGNKVGRWRVFWDRWIWNSGLISGCQSEYWNALRNLYFTGLQLLTPEQATYIAQIQKMQRDTDEGGEHAAKEVPAQTKEDSTQESSKDDGKEPTKAATAG